MKKLTTKQREKLEREGTCTNSQCKAFKPKIQWCLDRHPHEIIIKLEKVLEVLRRG